MKWGKKQSLLGTLSLLVLQENGNAGRKYSHLLVVGSTQSWMVMEDKNHDWSTGKPSATKIGME